MEKQTVFKDEETIETKQTDAQKVKTSTGLEEHIAGMLCYLAGFITGIIFLIIEKDNRFVRFHAMQSIFIFATIVVFSVIINIIPIIGLLISFLMGPISIVLWIFLMIKAYQGKQFKLPIIGDLAEKQLKSE